MGVAARVYGLSNAATTPNGASHWGDTRVLAALAVALVSLTAFAVIEARSNHALLPVRLLRSRDRVGAYLVMLSTGTAVFGMYFFLTLFLQDVWGYSALRTGVAYLPYAAAVVVLSTVASQTVARVGPRALLIAGSLLAAAGLLWQSQITAHSSYPGAVLGPLVVGGAGLGLLFVPLTLVALHRVPGEESGAASGVLNACQQVGGSIGLAVLGTVAWTAVANNLRAPAGHVTGSALHAHALAVGFSRAFLIGAGIMLLAVAVSAATIRIRRGDLAQAPGSLQPDRFTPAVE